MRTVWTLDDAEASRLIGEGRGVTEVARQLGVSRQAIYVAIRKGRVPAPIPGGPRADVMPREGTHVSSACAGSD